MRGLFVSGTDTGVGKSVLTAAITAALLAGGQRVRALKPVITGLDDPPDPVWPRDHELLAALTGSDPLAVSPIGFGPAVSPHLAAELAGRPLEPGELAASVAAAAREDADVLLVEGVGGLLVPLAPGYDVRALIADAGLPLVLAARPGLGTINHTLLTLEAARSRGLEVRGVVITPWPSEPDEMTRSNRDTIARLGGVEVSVLPFLERPDPALLAHAAAAFPLERWLAPL
jgi:dethiobiotin synthetase